MLRIKSEKTFEGLPPSIKIDFRKLSGFSRFQLLHFAVRYGSSHPLQEYVFDCTHSQLGRLLSYMSGQLSFSFGNLSRDLSHHRFMLEQDSLYNQLLLLGATKELLRRLFTKSHREVDVSRRHHGIKGSGKGRPGRLSRESSYEIAARYEMLREELQEPVLQLIQLAEEFPELNINSIFKLIRELENLASADMPGVWDD